MDFAGRHGYFCTFILNLRAGHFSPAIRQGSNALNKSMQGLWSTHRRGKINLNATFPSVASLTTSTSEASSTPTPLFETQDADASTSTSLQPVETDSLIAVPEDRSVVASGKRRGRISRLPGEENNKRAKLSNQSGNVSRDYNPPSTRLSDLGGVDACIEKMLELVAMPLCHPEIYIHTGIQPPRGVLLHGPPGCGKTLLANAIAGVRIHIYAYINMAGVLLTTITGIRCPVHQYFSSIRCFRHVGRVRKDTTRHVRRGQGPSAIPLIAVLLTISPVACGTMSAIHR